MKKYFKKLRAINCGNLNIAIRPVPRLFFSKNTYSYKDVNVVYIINGCYQSEGKEMGFFMITLDLGHIFSPNNKCLHFSSHLIKCSHKYTVSCCF